MQLKRKELRYWCLSGNYGIFQNKLFFRNKFEQLFLQKNHRRCSVRKGVLRNFAKFTLKNLCQSLFFIKVTALRTATLLKKRLWHWCFPVNFAKFRRPHVSDYFYFYLAKVFWNILFGRKVLRYHRLRVNVYLKLHVLHNFKTIYEETFWYILMKLNSYKIYSI